MSSRKVRVSSAIVHTGVSVNGDVHLVIGGPKSVGMVEVGFRRKYNRNAVEGRRGYRRVCNCVDFEHECGS